jgi:hypothetical protein
LLQEQRKEVTHKKIHNHSPQKGAQQFNKKGSNQKIGENKSKKERAKNKRKKHTHHYT